MSEAQTNPSTGAAEVPAKPALQSGRQLGLYSCRACGRVSERENKDLIGRRYDCPRCGTRLTHQFPDSLNRSSALTAAALILYVPANLLPVMSTVALTGKSDHTILGGIYELWLNTDYLLAVIVFIASIAVPLAKLLVMVLLIATAARRSTWRSRERATLYRWTHAVGHWSVLDVFVVVLLVGMINYGPFGGVRPESGLVAFGAVVVLTILAVTQFDPRLLWPAPRPAAPIPPATPSHPTHE